MSNLDDPRVKAGMAAQGAALDTALAGGAERLGWKAGLGTAAAMEKVGTTTPVAGFLTTATLVAGGGEVATAGWGNPVFEPELAVRLGADLAPGGDLAAAQAAIAAIAPAIELVDLGAPDDLEQVLATNIFHRAVVLGAWVPADADAVAAARLEVVIDGAVHAADVDPGVALGAPAAVVRALADQVALGGQALRAGDVVITGSAIAAVALDGATTLEVRLADGPAVAVAVR